MPWKNSWALICAAGFGTSHALGEIVPSAARNRASNASENSDALYHNVEHTLLVTLRGA